MASFIDANASNIPLQFSTCYKRGQDDVKQKTSYTGNSAKSLHVSVEESLKKLRTSYIDILYVHFVRYASLLLPSNSSL